MTKRIHDFKNDHAQEQGLVDAPFWEKIYSQAFPNYYKIVAAPKGSEAQLSGLDRWLLLDSGDVIKCQEKTRKESYTNPPDVALELEHQYDSGYCKPGWIEENLQCDYLAYVILPERLCYLFPYLEFKAAYEENKADWLRSAKYRRGGFRLIEALNKGGYKTVNLIVPKAALFEFVPSALTIRW